MSALSAVAPPVAVSEPALVAAVRAGDDLAFERLHARYRERIFAFILSRVHDHGRAEDIAQEVFLSAVRRLRSDDRPVAFKPWIYEIAKNACVDEHRRRARSREVSLDDEPEPGVERGLPSSAARTPVAAIADRQQLDDLRGAFGGLSENHHRLLVMREFEGLSYDEIGERLGMSRQVVESGLFRARRKLTEEYEELASGRRCEQVQGSIEAGSLQSAAALGVRVRLRVARHLSHCQPCRHAALMAGVDPALVRRRSIAAKIAALLPYPLTRWWPWRHGGGRHGAHAGSGPSSTVGHAGAIGSLNAAASVAPPASSAALGQTVATLAALAIAGAGGGLAGALAGSGQQQHRPASVVRHVGASGSGAAHPTAGPAHRAVPATPVHTARDSRPASRRHRGDGGSGGGPAGAGATGSSPGATSGSPSGA
ncbi:MAG: RNA polymerase sigma factor, partial [Solirubrobacteraceae bacterium]